MVDNHTQESWVPERTRPDAADVPAGASAPVSGSAAGTSGASAGAPVGARSAKRREHRASRLLEAMSGKKAPETETPVEQPLTPGVGQVLRTQREALGLTPQDISARIKFPHQRIVALEEERWADLQSGFLLRALVRQYAECVGLNPEHALTLLAMSHGTEHDVPYAESCRSTPTKEGYGTVYAEAQAAAQAAAKNIPYNVPRSPYLPDEPVDPVSREPARAGGHAASSYPHRMPAAMAEYAPPVSVSSGAASYAPVDQATAAPMTPPPASSRVDEASVSGSMAGAVSGASAASHAASVGSSAAGHPAQAAHHAAAAPAQQPVEPPAAPAPTSVESSVEPASSAPTQAPAQQQPAYHASGLQPSQVAGKAPSAAATPFTQTSTPTTKATVPQRPSAPSYPSSHTQTQAQPRSQAASHAQPQVKYPAYNPAKDNTPAQPRPQGIGAWMRDRQNWGVMAGIAVVIVLILMIIYLLLTS